MKKLSFKNSDNLTVDEAFQLFTWKNRP